ncbi:MAG TPA: hypothetical protein VJS44_09540 [Pyrinomonadaceae bacterium]|nr:hypothetical protein [Pyrinomonadaceae bacterium]
MTGKTNLLIGATLRDSLRWAARHVYALAVLMPLVLGMSYLTLAQAASYDLNLPEPSLFVEVLLAAGFVVGAQIVSLSRASREVYHLRRPSIFVEALPVERREHLHFALFVRAGRTLLLGLALLLIHSVLSRESLSVISLPALAIFCALMTVSESYAAINWIHWGHARGKLKAAQALAVLLAGVLTGSLLLVIFFNEAALLSLAARLRLSGPVWAGVVVYAAGAALTFIIYLLARLSHERWRGEDIDYAQRLEERAWPEFNFTRFLRGRLPRSVCALLARDLSLSLRIFSSAVYVSAGISLLIVALLLTLLLSASLPGVEETLGGLRDLGWMSATWFPASLAIKAAVLALVACLASIVPVLVSHQIPHVWLERAVGATANDLWLAKLWYARLLTLPVVLAVFVLGVAAALMGGTPLPLYYLPPLLAECLWLWWLASTIIGALAYEMPDRPGLALVLMLSLALSLGALTIVLWPMGLGIYGMGVAQANERGIMQAARYLMTEEL